MPAGADAAGVLMQVAGAHGCGRWRCSRRAAAAFDAGFAARTGCGRAIVLSDGLGTAAGVDDVGALLFAYFQRRRP